MVVTKVSKPLDRDHDRVTSQLRQRYNNLQDRYLHFVYPRLSKSNQYFRA